jgi:hypothetical protein
MLACPGRLAIGDPGGYLSLHDAPKILRNNVAEM